MIAQSLDKNLIKSANKNIGLLSAAQAIVGSQQALIMSVGAMVGMMLAPDPSLATLPITFMVLGLALFAGPAAILAHRLGRTKAFILGATISVIAGIIAATGIFLSSFIIFCVALAIGGSAAAIGQQYRFAVADSVPDERKGSAVSWVMLVGVLAGFIGPALARWGREWFEGAEFAGSFIALSGLALLGIYVLSLTKLPKAESFEADQSKTPLKEIVRSPDVFVPIISGMASYGIMTFIMVAAPLAMVTMHGHSKEMAIMAVQWHIIFMYAPSFFVAFIISHIGARAITAIGLVIILISVLSALNGVSAGHFNVAMILLGIGWNFGFIGSTTLLSNGYKPQDGAKTQALNEQLVFGTMAVVSIGAGILLNMIGWQAINLLVVPVALGAIALLVWGGWRSKQN